MADSTGAGAGAGGAGGAGEGPVAGGGKILVADDDQSLVRTLTWILKENGYEVVTAPGGEGLIGKLEAERPHLLLLDIMMPKIDGLQLLAKMKADERFRDIPEPLVGLHLRQQLQTIDLGHHDVEEQEVGPLRFELADQSLAPGRRHHLVAVLFQDPREGADQGLVVVGDQNLASSSDRTLPGPPGPPRPRPRPRAVGHSAFSPRAGRDRRCRRSRSAPRGGRGARPPTAPRPSWRRPTARSPRGRGARETARRRAGRHRPPGRRPRAGRAAPPGARRESRPR